MAFLDDELDLTNTLYTQENLKFSRNFYLAVISKLAPQWLSEPKSCLSVFWNQSGVYSACYLMDLCRVITTIEPTKKSTPVFEKKVVELFNAKDETQYEAVLAELQVASILSKRISPIAFEPLVPNKHDVGRKPASPDFAVKLPSGVVLIDVTIPQMGEFISWRKAVNDFQNHLNKKILNKKLRRSITMSVPLSFRMSFLSKDYINELIKDICNSDEGFKQLVITDDIGEIKWELMPHLIKTDEIEINVIIEPKSSTVVTVGNGTTTAPPAVSFATNILLNENINEIAVKSIRHSLDDKKRRGQFPKGLPSIIVIKLGYEGFTFESLTNLIHQRIWTNSAYSWLSGICIYRHGRNIEKNDAPSDIQLTINPKARCPVPNKLIKIFEGQYQYHSY